MTEMLIKPPCLKGVAAASARLPGSPRITGKLAASALLFLSGGLACAATSGNAVLADMSLEELANIEIISVSKRPESLADAPASVFVITAEEIRRSGAATLPEAMRLAPNLQVAQVDARNYAVSARGFNNPFANKLLVLIDGRTIYSPLFSGVFWDAQDVVLEDISRIEVISGPGATLWGANAVNGVINIITKPAADTQGMLAAAGASHREKTGVVRYGGALEGGGHYRVYGKVAEGNDSRNGAGADVLTGWRRQQTGFRTDWSDASQQVTLQGDAYRGALHQAGTADIDIGGANLNGRITTRLGSDASLSVQLILDYTERKQPAAFAEYLHTLDAQVQHSVRLGDIHQLVWGGGYRMTLDHVRNENAFAFLPGAETLHWANIFVQDEIELSRKLRLTAGVKVENDTHTATEVLPTLRLAWKPAPDKLLWTSVSRAARTPSRIDRDFYMPSSPPVVNGVPQYALAGGPDFRSRSPMCSNWVTGRSRVPRCPGRLPCLPAATIACGRSNPTRTARARCFATRPVLRPRASRHGAPGNPHRTGACRSAAWRSVSVPRCCREARIVAAAPAWSTATRPITGCCVRRMTWRRARNWT